MNALEVAPTYEETVIMLIALLDNEDFHGWAIKQLIKLGAMLDSKTS